MRVRCPGCSERWRVEDRDVPDVGAKLLCPACGLEFIAKRPAGEILMAPTQTSAERRVPSRGPVQLAGPRLFDAPPERPVPSTRAPADRSGDDDDDDDGPDVGG